MAVLRGTFTISYVLNLSQVFEYIIKEDTPGISIFGGDMSIRDSEVGRIEHMRFFKVRDLRNVRQFVNDPS